MKIQNEDVKSEAELVSAGATKARLINDTKLYLSVFGLNLRLDEAISNFELGDSAPPLRLYATSTPDNKLNIAPSQIISRDGTTKLPGPIASLINSFPVSTINFQTGAATGGTTGGTFSLTRPNVTVGQFVRMGLTFMGSGQVTCLFSSPSGSLGGLSNPGSAIYDSAGLAMGYIDLESTGAFNFKTAGSSSNVIENSVGGTSRIFRFSIVAGSGGGSSFNVDDILVNANNEVLTNSNFNVLTV